MKSPNQLHKSSSPYLLQHANNPVWWKLWNEDNLANAREEDKLIIVSIGYSACHWCHVMEHECFEDEEVASVMNELYLSIKVDREERPDIDQVYMDACQLITQRGGWPLNAICLPDGRPVYAGTYFPKENWLAVLRHLHKEYTENREAMIDRAEHILKGMHLFEQLDPIKETFSPTARDRELIFAKIDERIDYEYGGTKGAPKFAMPVLFKFLLEYYFYTQHPKALEAVETMAENVLLRGCFDHVEGGFMRYAVDAYWEIPHFEKMLYDNGQLIGLYAALYKVRPDEEYKQAVYRTVSFVKQSWTNEEGGFYAAFDADSEGEEGKYYVTSYEYMMDLNIRHQGWVEKLFDINPTGNFEGHIHLNRTGPIAAIAKINRVDPIALWDKYEEIAAELKLQRNHRVKPGLDNKVIASWNALMIKGLLEASQTFGEDDFLTMAATNYRFAAKNFLDSSGFLRRTKDHQGFLDDYALMIEAALLLFSQTGERQYWEQALLMLHHVEAHFDTADHILFYYTSDLDTPLITRKKELSDNVIPASNSIMAKNLFVIGSILGDLKRLERSREMVKKMYETIVLHPTFYAGWASALLWFVDEPYVLVISGERALYYSKELNKVYLPNTLILIAETESDIPCFKGKYVAGKTLMYLCKGNHCMESLAEIEEVKTIILEKDKKN
jgi:uncharacterized protein YyaL (SSP411 family)